jgi:hypothetical protein
MAFLIRCPVCRDKFSHDATKPFPDECPSCHEFIGSGRDDTVITMPALRSAATKANDDVYRQMERSSEHRAEQAAQMAGVPVSEMSDLKITNLRDNKGYGDVMAPPPPSLGGFGGGAPIPMPAQLSDPMRASALSSQGPHPNAGARMQSVIREMHAKTGQGHAVGDRPALETEMPGYRRRV